MFFMKTILHAGVGHLLSKVDFFPCIATVVLLSCSGCETRIQSHGAYMEELRARGYIGQMSNTYDGGSFKDEQLERAYQILERIKAEREALRSKYDKREHVPGLLEKYGSADPKHRAYLADAWVCPGMTKEMVLDTLLGAEPEWEQVSETGHWEGWKWRAWKLIFKDGKLVEIGRFF